MQKGFEKRGIHTRVHNIVKRTELDYDKHMNYLVNKYGMTLAEARKIYLHNREEDLRNKSIEIILKEIKKKEMDDSIALAGLFGLMLSK